MLEHLSIFTRGGLILWTFGNIALKGSPIDTLIRSCLLEDRSGAASYNHDVPGAAYTLKWTFDNEWGLVFVAVYQRILHLLYVGDLLEMVKREFSKVYEPKRMVYRDFDHVFQQLKKEAEELPEKPVKQKSGGAVDGNGCDKDAKKKSRNHVAETGNGNPAPEVAFEGNVANGKEKRSSNTAAGAFDKDKLKMIVRANKVGKKKKSDVAPVTSKRPVPKEKRVSDDQPSKESESDFTGDDNVAVLTDIGDSMMDMKEEIESDQEDDNKGWFSSMFNSIAGKANLDRADLEPALKALKERLMTKNVAEEIAEKLCESVAASLEGKKHASFTRISSTVQAAMEEALVRISTPRRSIDILRDVHDAKDQRKPYVVVFVGVNGVGKSTNLAKVAYWLQHHSVSVMMAACDTFRTGAVEQLRTHARRLQVPMFDKGYGKDPALVAKQAIQEATRNGSDVLLVDTAGRMQDNEPLMRALSKLVYVNNPDLILFVGEALVGNDAVDQLAKFNQKLGDLSPSPNPRLIDGILLTKFDTVDDKVGAALSMVYTSGAPVMFVGCGQSYTDLKKLSAKALSKTLLK